MAGILGDAFIQIRPAMEKFTGELSSGIKAAATDAEVASSGSFDKLAGVGKAAFLGIAGAAVIFGGAAVDAALKGQEATAQLANAVRATGGDFETFEPKVAKLSGTFATLGFTNDEVEAGLTRMIQTTGNSAQSLGLMGLAADVAAARHMDLVSAAQLVGKVAEGNVTQLKRLTGVTVEGASAAEKAANGLALLNERFGGAAQAQADTYAGKLKAFKAEAENLTEQVGNALLPVLADLAGDAAGVVRFLEGNQVAAAALAVVIGGPLAIAMGVYIVQQTIALGLKVADFFESGAIAALYAADAIKAAGAAVYEALGPVGLAAIAFTALAVAFDRSGDSAAKAGHEYAQQFIQNVQGVGNETQILQGKLAELRGEQERLIEAKDRAISSDGTYNAGLRDTAKALLASTGQYSNNAAQIKVVQGELNKLTTGTKAAGDAQKAAAAAGVTLTDQNQAVALSTTDVAAATGQSVDVINLLVSKLNIDLSKAHQNEIDKLYAQAEALGYNSSTSLTLHNALGVLADQTANATDKAKAFKTALDEVIGGNIDAEKAVVNFQNSIDGLSQKLQGNKLSMDATTKAGRDNITAVEDAVVAIRNHVEALQNQGASADALKGAFDGDTTALRNQLAQAGMTKAQIDALIQSYGLVPSSINTVITADFSKAYAAAATFAQSFATLLDKDIPAPFRGKVLGKGAYFPGGQPELAVVGDTREVVLPLDDPQRMADLLAQAGMGGATGPAASAPGPLTGGGGGVTVLPGAVQLQVVAHGAQSEHDLAQLKRVATEATVEALELVLAEHQGVHPT